MELEISKRTLVLGLIGLLGVVLLVVGYTLSPRVVGHPVLLSPANWKLTRYLDQAQGWMATLEEEQARLVSMIPLPGPASQGELPAITTPVVPSSIYERSRILERSLSHLGRVRQQMEETETPTPLKPLHALALATADECLRLHGAVSTALGSPSQGARSRADVQAQTSGDHLLALRRALEAQLALLGDFTPTPTVTPTSTPITTGNANTKGL